MSKCNVHIKLRIKNTGSGFDELIELFTEKGNENPTPFNSLIPMPKDIWETIAASDDEDTTRSGTNNIFIARPINLIYEKKRHGLIRRMSSSEEAEHQLSLEIKKDLLKKYGTKNWRQWSIENWGTLWEAYNVQIKYRDKEEVLISFTTSQFPPLKILRKISEEFPQLTFVYDIYSYEMCFALAGGYSHDFPFCLEESGWISSTEYKYQAVILSNKFINFCNRFSKFPIGGRVLRAHNPFVKRRRICQLPFSVDYKEVRCR